METVVAVGHEVRLSAASAQITEVRDVARREAFARAIAAPERTLLALDFDKGPGFFSRHKLVPGESEKDKAISARPLDDQHWGGFVRGARHNLFTAQPGVEIRFRYLLSEKTILLVRGYNRDRKANCGTLVLEPVVGAWGTLVIHPADFTEGANKAGDALSPADLFTSFEILVGRADKPVTFLLDDLVIVETTER